MNVPILIPVSMLDAAKSRLAAVLTPEQRETLTLITLGTVLHAAGPDAIVLTPDERVATFAAGKARITMETPGVKGLNPQLERAIEALMAEGDVTDRLLILHADLPLVRRSTLEALLAADAGPDSVTLVESPDGGTNAMLQHPPGRFPLSYGSKSFGLHAAAAAAAGMTVNPMPGRELELDLDTPEDITELLSTARGQQTAAGHYLLSLGLGQEGAFK